MTGYKRPDNDPDFRDSMTTPPVEQVLIELSEKATPRPWHHGFADLSGVVGYDSTQEKEL